MSKNRLLGTAVLAYAFLTSGALLSVAQQGWAGAADGALWLAYVLGGFGLIRGKRWGRPLTLLASGASLLAAVIAVVVLLMAAGVEFTNVTAASVLASLPALAIFVSALLLRQPSSSEAELPPAAGTGPKPSRSQRTLHDIAYVSFMVLGLISLWASYFIYSEIQAAGGSTGGVDGVLGFLVIIPFGIPIVLALVIGPGLSLYLWRDYRLLTLTALLVALAIALSSLGYAAWPILLPLYAAVSIPTGLIWFKKYRSRLG